MRTEYRWIRSILKICVVAGCMFIARAIPAHAMQAPSSGVPAPVPKVVNGVILPVTAEGEIPGDYQLIIPGMDINVPVYIGDAYYEAAKLQEIVDNENSAGMFDLYGQRIIADHGAQSFKQMPRRDATGEAAFLVCVTD